jgi:hypothetical protein
MESEYINRTGQLKEYIKLHIISLEQDLENISQEMEELDPESKACKELDYEYNYISGQSIATRHILSVVEDIMGS